MNNDTMGIKISKTFLAKDWWPSFVWFFAELNRGNIHQCRFMWKYPMNIIAKVDFVLPDSTEIRRKTCKKHKSIVFFVHFGRNIIRIVLLFCAIRVIYVLPNKERQVHIMKTKSDLHWNQSRDRSWHRRLKTYLEQHRIMNGYQAVHTILQDTDWTKRVYCISRRK